MPKYLKICLLSVCLRKQRSRRVLRDMADFQDERRS